MIEVEDIVTLPKGRAFVLVNGGEIYKIRVPLTKYCFKKDLFYFSYVRQQSYGYAHVNSHIYHFA